MKKERPQIYPGVPISVDPDGSYTGRPRDGEKPQQDADDLLASSPAEQGSRGAEAG